MKNYISLDGSPSFSLATDRSKQRSCLFSTNNCNLFGIFGNGLHSKSERTPTMARTAPLADTCADVGYLIRVGEKDCWVGRTNQVSRAKQILERTRRRKDRRRSVCAQPQSTRWSLRLCVIEKNYLTFSHPHQNPHQRHDVNAVTAVGIRVPAKWDNSP